ncbi:hypothetical protein BDZ45DRAFT_722895 [Acephala macrosclerotiorum]|nr:hypothetical protein BDZ45DRAFT_722895 [Acephala macrosclerotiorum]
MDAPWPRTWPEKTELHVFDPEGDVLLILERSLKENDLVEYVNEGKSESVPEGDFVSDDAPPPPVEVTDRPELVPESGPWEPQLESPEDEVGDMVKPESSASASLASRETKPRVEKVQMRASSKHLILASSTFRTSLGSDTYSEGRMLRNEGNLVVSLPDEDPDAMIILLNIIHGLSRKVPRRVDLNMLSKLAIAIKYRQMHEAVELWSDTWIENLKRDKGLPGSYTPELLSWLFIFWEFQKDEDFRKVCQILERVSDDSLGGEVETVHVGPYIPTSVIHAIQERRIDAIESMMAIIHELITKYSGPNILCDKGSDFFCDANLLGSLLKASVIIGIWPRPEHPYLGMNSGALADRIRGMRVLDGCEKITRGGRFLGSGFNHGIKNSIEASVRSLEDRMLGLDLTSFLSKTSK